MDWKETFGHALWQFGSRALPFRRAFAGFGLRASKEWYAHRVDRVSLAGGHHAWLTGFDENYLSFQLFWYGWHYFEPFTVSLVLELTRDPIPFIDIGANIGYYAMSVAAARRRRGAFVAQTVAFEPNPKLQRLLRTNVLNNGYAIQTKALALSDDDGVGRLHIGRSDLSATLEANPDAVDCIDVPTITLDTYAQRSVLGSGALIKLDAQGHESHVLRGGLEALSQLSPELIIDGSQPLSPDVNEALLALGYRFYHISGEGLIRSDCVGSLRRGELRYPNVWVTRRNDETIQHLSQPLIDLADKVDLSHSSLYQPE